MNPLAEKSQQKWADLRDEQAHTKEHDEILIGLDRIQRATLQSHQASIAALAAHEPSVTVKNPVESVKTPDVGKVVNAIEQLIRVQKAVKTDYTPIVKELRALVPVLKSIPKQIEMPEPTEEVEITNFEEITPLLESIKTSLEALVNAEAKELVVSTPVVEVNEREIDFSPLTKSNEAVIKAIESIHIPEIPVDDDTMVMQALAQVEDAVRTLRFPIPTVATDPLIRFKIADIDDATAVHYYGNIDPNGAWYIMKEDSTAKTYRYASGSRDYPTNWTNRAILTYDYMSSSLF
jgi:hypothetical protein